MLIDEIKYQIEQEMPFAPTSEQASAIDEFARFLTDSEPHSLMILRGSAGTGKTSLASAIVRMLRRLRQRVVLLAPTGRAAKVFSTMSGAPASTIHRAIYRQKSLDGEGGTFGLSFNKAQHTLFLVDEASMISNSGFADSAFGTGRLLDDLVQFVYSGQGCRIVFLGDTAQLPPVGASLSPALNADEMGFFGMTVYQSELNEVVRQAQESGILYNATIVRRMISQAGPIDWPQIQLKNFADIVAVPGDELIEQLSDSYSRVGQDETIVVTRSNKRANVYNQGIRARVLDYEEELCRGDVLMVVKNKYLPPSDDEDAMDFIANGDRAVVWRVRNEHELYGFRFAELTLRFPDYDDRELQLTTILDTLTAESPALTREQQEHLYYSVLEDYADVPRKADRLKKVQQDSHYGALQVKYGYAVTCHKAQGGQWAHVYVDQGYMTTEMLNNDYLRWLYTAFTRATEKLFLVNWKEQ